ncbi:hypothetical protein GCM10011608_10720 [Micromonospora sonchi]|uniref:Uncharacterized protein n=1 Tax=Micromonospora sonchi TaxID=1763543 RepID=A0A917WTQ1_9ACTN|nr:hypothetical protein [Micromonospora sonchi]GGM27760.1 hypothetical protein GCM10011608_10720 [Micromonospora sonchi]
MTDPATDPTAAIAAARSLADPAERARAIGVILGKDGLPKITSELRAERQAAVLELRSRNMSWTEVGEAIGQHRNRAQQIGEGRSGGRPARPAAS